VLIGVALDVWFSVLFRVLALTFTGDSVVSFIGDIGSANAFMGLRSMLGGAIGEAPYTIRNVLLYFLVLFVMRSRCGAFRGQSLVGWPLVVPGFNETLPACDLERA
jgi:hypothetical protein